MEKTSHATKVEIPAGHEIRVVKLTAPDSDTRAHRFLVVLEKSTTKRGLKDLHYHSYVEVDGRYYKPVDTQNQPGDNLCIAIISAFVHCWNQLHIMSCPRKSSPWLEDMMPKSGCLGWGRGIVFKGVEQALKECGDIFGYQYGEIFGYDIHVDKHPSTKSVGKSRMKKDFFQEELVRLERVARLASQQDTYRAQIQVVFAALLFCIRYLCYCYVLGLHACTYACRYT